MASLILNDPAARNECRQGPMRRAVRQSDASGELHQLDRVAGAAHFDVTPQRGVELVRQLRTRLPGYAVPRYVRETPGAPNKELLA